VRRLVRILATLALCGLALVGFAAVARSATDIPTTLEVAQDPAYVYLLDEVTLTATVTPNSGSGVVQFEYPYYGSWNRVVVPVEADGTATLVATAAPDLNGSMVVHAEFYNGVGYANSLDFFLVDLRYLPGVNVLDPPSTPTQSDDVSIAFTAPSGTAVQCRLDGGPWSGCQSPWAKSNLAEGSHTWEAQATNPDGRSGAIRSVTWVVDQTPPVPGTLELNGGLPSTNHGDVWLQHPATDTLSAIHSVRVSRTGQLDADGNLLLDSTNDTYWRRWDQLPQPGHAWSVRMDESGPQTVWVQWFDAAGNASEIESAAIDVRAAKPRLGGLWSTTGGSVPFSISGVSASEMKSLRIVNGWHNLEYNLGNATVFGSPPSTWDVGAAPADDGLPGRLRLVVIQWQDEFGQWSDSASVPIALLDHPIPDIILDEGAGVTPDPVVQGRWAPTEVLRYMTDWVNIAYSCDGESWWGGWWTGGYLPMYVNRVEAGCPSGNGPRTLSLRWMAECCTYSDIRTVTIDLQQDPDLPLDDEQGPVGDVSVAGGAAAVSSSTVTLATPANDEATSVTNVRLSNDGVNWTTRAYNPTQAWTLTPGAGSKRVWAQWKDAARNWSEPIFATVVVDTSKPAVSGLKIGFATGATATTAGSVPVKPTWSGTDTGSGIDYYDVALSTDDGAYRSLGTTTSPSSTRRLTGGHTYRFRIRPVDKAGNIGGWTYSATVRRTLPTASIKYSGTWRTSSCSACIGGSQRVSRDAGAGARLTFTGRAVGYIATVGSGQGSARIYVDGALVDRVNLSNASAANRKIVWSTRWSSVGTHTVRIVVVGPDGGPRVTLDAIAVLK
jgi:hypothetical protein